MQASLKTLHVEVRYRIRQVEWTAPRAGLRDTMPMARRAGEDSGYSALILERRSISLGHSFISFIQSDPKWASLNPSRQLLHIGLRLSHIPPTLVLLLPGLSPSITGGPFDIAVSRSYATLIISSCAISPCSLCWCRCIVPITSWCATSRCSPRWRRPGLCRNAGRPSRLSCCNPGVASRWG